MAGKGRETQSHPFAVRLLTQVSLVRNLPDVPFPGRLSDKAHRSVGDRLAERVIEVLGAEDVTDDETLAVTAEAMYGLLPASERKAGYHLLQIGGAPEGVALWCEVMCSNHLTFSACGTWRSSTAAHEALQAVVKRVEQQIAFAYDETLGYLSAQLTLVGTGLRIRSWMHLAGITHFNYLNELTNAADSASVLVEMDEGCEPPPGCLYILFNKTSLDASAEELVARFDRFLGQVEKQERQARERLAADETFLLLDRLVRVQAVLGNALLMNEAEALDALSDLRLGADVGALEKVATGPERDDWFEELRDGPFVTRFVPKLEDRVTLPEQVAEVPQWRLDAYRAAFLKIFAEFDISKTFLKRRMPR